MDVPIGGEELDPGEQTTGTRDEHFNLISVAYHALQGAENCGTYALDAEAAGDERLATFFREAQAEQSRLAARAKELLGIGGATSGASGIAAPDTAELGTEVPQDTDPVDVRGRVAPEVGFPPEGTPGPESPPETDVPPATPPRGAQRGTSPAPPREAPPEAGREPPPPGPPPDANPPA